MKKSVLIIASAISLIALETQAQGGMGGQGDRAPRPEFSEVDVDANGYVSADELAVLNESDEDDRAARMMSRMDADEDGQLSEEEFNTRPQRNAGGMGGQ